MTWWETVLLGAGGAGGAWAAVRKVLRSRTLRRAVAHVIEPERADDGARVDTVAELRGLLDEQRRVLDAHIASAGHLATRVGHLEQTVEELRAALDRARTREMELEAELTRERALSGARIAQLERRLADARHRIEELEARLAAKQG